PYTAPSDVFQIFKKEFEVAYEEGGIFQLTMHPHHIGHRSRIWILEELISFMKGFKGVWFATHEDVARIAKAS
ncbi:polysaccharide deacetylase, partial [Cribrihabitans sp. XS_ASV171]